MGEERTQVGIVGAGPAGLVLGHLLHLRGIDAVVLEARSREYVEQRVRAGVLEQGTVRLLEEIGAGERLERQGLVHEGVAFRFGGRERRVDFADLTGRAITVYGQQEVVKDLIAARLGFGGPLLFEVEDVHPEGFETEAPALRYRQDGAEHVLRCDVIAGCDGFHGVCRDAVPAGALTFHDRDWPFAWLGILAEAQPSSDELIYAHDERGFALQSMRSPTVTRLYLQCDPSDQLDAWRHERIWEELQARLGGKVNEGPIFDRGITPMRSFVTEPMQHGRLYLAGDAVHIVPPTGAKGLNLAVADVYLLADALDHWFASGDDSRLRGYSDACLRRVWRTQYFSWWMTSMLHRMPDDVDGFQSKLQLAQLEYVCSSRAASKALAENYVGFDLQKNK
jgi:p-hydroxybenzoate 3-monooxygenase